mgnify:CR=1 FL=1
MVSIHYHKNETLLYINKNSQLEQYRNNGCFSKKEILLLLSLDDLTDDDLGIKPQKERLARLEEESEEIAKNAKSLF